MRWEMTTTPTNHHSAVRICFLEHFGSLLPQCACWGLSALKRRKLLTLSMSQITHFSNDFSVIQVRHVVVDHLTTLKTA